MLMAFLQFSASKTWHTLTELLITQTVYNYEIIINLDIYFIDIIDNMFLSQLEFAQKIQKNSGRMPEL